MTQSSTHPVMLSDGSEANVRQLRPADRSRVEQLFGGASASNLYARFFTVGNAVVTRHIDRLFCPEVDNLTYVLEQGDRLLGIADVEPVSESSAEIALLVDDRSHGLGIGTLLLERAAEDAWDRGVTTFVADVLAVNHPMIEVFRYAGFDVQLISQQGQVSVQMSTRRTAEAVAATAARHASALGRRHVRPMNFAGSQH